MATIWLGLPSQAVDRTANVAASFHVAKEQKIIASRQNSTVMLENR